MRRERGFQGRCSRPSLMGSGGKLGVLSDIQCWNVLAEQSYRDVYSSRGSLCCLTLSLFLFFGFCWQYVFLLFRRHRDYHRSIIMDRLD